MTHDLTGLNSHFSNMVYLARLGFNVVPGRFVAGNTGKWFDYWFEPGIGIHMKNQDGEEIFMPFPSDNEEVANADQSPA